MSNLRTFAIFSLLSKVVIVSTIYYTVFSNNTTAGVVILAAHGVYELAGYFMDREYQALQQEEASKLAELINQKMGGGSC